MTAIVALIIVLLLSAVLGGAEYYLVLTPKRWREPYHSALLLLERGATTREELEQADALLAGAVNAGPRGGELNRIRFAQAYLRGLLGVHDADRYRAAVAVLDELIGAEGRTPDSAYLELWLQASLGNQARVTELYDDQRVLLEDRAESRRIASISHLHLAMGHWRQRELDQAERHFDQVRQLGELAEQIPAEAENLHLARAIQAASDEKMDEARAAYAAARERAVERQGSTVEPELGLLLCDWPHGGPHALGDWLGRLAQQAAFEQPARKSSAEEQSAEDPDERDRGGVRLRAGIALLRLVALIREPLNEPAPPGKHAGAPSPAWFAELARRAEAVRGADPELGDADLIEGLIRYYFAFSQQERESALAILEHGAKLGDAGVLPEVLDLIERERKLGGEGDGISRYLALLAAFIADPSISMADRMELERIRTRFARYGKPVDGAAKLPGQRDQTEGAVGRAEALGRQIEYILAPRIRDLAPEDPIVVGVREQLARLREVGALADQGTAALQKVEVDLVARVAQTMLPEEDHVRAP